MNMNVAFIRGINVGGHAIVKMDDLKRTFAAAGCDGVKTYIQSGNIIFGAPDADPTAVLRKVESGLVKLLGGEVVVLYRSLRELEEMVRCDPFKEEKTGADDKRYVTFLSRKPTTKPKLPLCSEKEALKAFRVRNLDVFVVSWKRNGRYGFPNTFIEKELGVPTTTRNWSTVTRIVEGLP